jgi:tRNA(Phe) wybutosine-synthesizing methylase Tyw3
MANKFRPIKENTEQQQDRTEMNRPKVQPEEVSQTVRTAAPKEKKPRGKAGKKIRKAFVDIFGLGILRKINLKKNLPYFIMVIIMIIALIYNNLNIQSKKSKIEQLEDEITKINDMLMDAVEEEYNIDDKKEKELMQIAEEEGFQRSGYIPYTIKAEGDK